MVDGKIVSAVLHELAVEFRKLLKQKKGNGKEA
jgi:hypothetical protein